MNAQVGRDSIREPNIGRHGLHDYIKDNDPLLVDFVLAHNLVIRGTLFVHKKIHRGTWKTPDGNAVNQIEHIIIVARHRSNLLNVRVFRGANVDSDHCLIGSKIRARIDISKQIRERSANGEIQCGSSKE
jgi:hypothetical protein